MKKQIFVIVLSLILSGLLSACGQAGSVPAASGSSGEPVPLNVVATTGQIHDTVRNIAGEAVNLTGLFGPGVDPHLYVPTEGDVITLSEADVIFYNGLHLEAQMTRVMEQMASRGITVVAVGDELPADRLLNWDDSAPYDPHIWNDPELWRLVTGTIRETLIEADPAHAELYRQNGDRYLAEIEETHLYVQNQVARLPAERRIMITAHDAFGYFARTYDFEVRGLQGISTESEASTADVQELAEFIVERQVPAIFVESSVSPRNIEAVQAAVEAQGFAVKIGGQLYSDALGSPGTPAGTYTGMLHHNVDTLVEALTDQLVRVEE